MKRCFSYHISELRIAFTAILTAVQLIALVAILASFQYAFADSYVNKIVVNNSQVSEYTMCVGESTDFGVSVYDASGAIAHDGVVRWTISDSAVAKFLEIDTVSKKFSVVGTKAGHTNMTVSKDGYPDVTLSLTVYSPIYLNTSSSQSAIVRDIDNNALPSGSVVTSLDTSVATVSKVGDNYVVTAVSGGRGTLSITKPGSEAIDVPVFVNCATVFWNNNGHTATNIVAVGETPSYPLQSLPTKESTDTKSFVFSGWSPTVKTVAASDHIVNYDATFAETDRKYLITWVLGDKTVQEQYDRDATLSCKESTAKASTAQYSYEFLGWNIGDGNTVSTSQLPKANADMTITAVYRSTVRTYTVTFKNWDGSVLATKNVEYGVVPNTSDINPTRPSITTGTSVTNYTFDHWAPTLAAVSGNASYTAVFAQVTVSTTTPGANTYTITFKNWDGTVLQTESVADGAVPVYFGATPTRAASGTTTYTFSGWSPTITAAKASTTYTAVFSSSSTQANVKYTITFKNWDGTVLETLSVASGTVPSYTKSTPTRTGTSTLAYTFSGWTPSVVAATANATYTATFTSKTVQPAKSYTITFKNWDGTVLQRNDVATGTKPVYSGSTPTRPMSGNKRYTFSGWSPEIVNVTEAKTYTAQFKASDAANAVFTPAELKAMSTTKRTKVEFTAGTLYLMPSAVKALTALGTTIEIDVSAKTTKNTVTSASVTFYSYGSGSIGSSNKNTLYSNLGDFLLTIPKMSTGNVVFVKDGKADSYTAESFSTVNSDGCTVMLHTTSDIRTENKTSNFLDVTGKHWGSSVIDYAYAHGLVNGVGDGLFSPDSKLSRAQACTILYRAAQIPATSGGTAYADVDPFSWYARPVFWASSKGLINPVNNLSFGPHGVISRADQVLLLYNYAALNGRDVTGNARLTVFSDADAIRTTDQLKAINWAATSGIIKGDDAGALRPNDGTSRAEFCAMMQRFIDWYIVAE